MGTAGETIDQATRDMSRPHWQRSVANVVMGQMADELFAKPLIEILPSIEKIIAEAELIEDEADIGSVWAGAYAVSRLVLTDNFENAAYGDYKDSRLEGFDTYTYTMHQEAALREGLNTQAHFPINLAFAIQKSARFFGVNGYELHTLSDIGALVRRQDFRTLIDQAALTRNSFWGHHSVNVSQRMLGGFSILFNEDSVYFSSGQLAVMKESLQRVNRRGNMSLKAVNTQPSSGCPVRHLQPRFTDSPEDQRQLALLAEHYGKTPEELTAPRQQSVINDGLDRVAAALEHYSDDYAAYTQRKYEEENVYELDWA